MRMATPLVSGMPGFTIIGKIVAWKMNAFPRVPVAEIFVGKRGRVVLDVVEDVKRVMARIVEQAKSRLRRIDQYRNAAVRRNVGVPHFHPARHRNREIVGKTLGMVSCYPVRDDGTR